MVKFSLLIRSDSPFSLNEWMKVTIHRVGACMSSSLGRWIRIPKVLFFLLLTACYLHREETGAQLAGKLSPSILVMILKEETYITSNRS